MIRIRCLVHDLARSVFAALVVIACTAPFSRAADIPKEKQTTLGLYSTPQEAYEAWKADPDHVKVLDVRTPEEYLFVGHAEMAVNVPFAFQTFEWDAEKKHFAMKPNPDFVAEVKKWAQPGERIFVMCRSGGRSARAVNVLAGAGFTNVYNIVEGMEGDLVEDPSSPDYGKRMVNGWKHAGLPWTYAVDPERMRLPAGR